MYDDKTDLNPSNELVRVVKHYWFLSHGRLWRTRADSEAIRVSGGGEGVRGTSATKFRGFSIPRAMSAGDEHATLGGAVFGGTANGGSEVCARTPPKTYRDPRHANRCSGFGLMDSKCHRKT